jgi:two-component system, NarL family, response regulator
MEVSSRRRRGLTKRECEVLTLLARGYTGEEVARQLQVSGETVRAHVRNSVTKLHARTRLHAVVLALQRGEISLD